MAGVRASMVRRTRRREPVEESGEHVCAGSAGFEERGARVALEW